jgi:DNA primase
LSNTVEAIKERLTAAEVIGRRVQLRPSGRNLRGLCCFHAEKTPSFFVFPESNTYKCFGCNEGGDIFTFVMKTENLDFRDVLRQLAEEAGVPLTEGPQQSERAAARKAHISANSAAAGFFRKQLQEAPAAQFVRDYAAERRLDDRMLEQFQIGFAPDSWDALRTYMHELGYDDDALSSAGLARSSERGVYDVFRNRLMFPIFDRRSDIVGFGGRALGDDPAKYMNTPQTAAFDKGGVLYGLNLATESIRKAGSAVIVEGYMDVIAAHQHGSNNVVAAMGTAITPTQVRLLRGMAKRLVLALDADTAGAAATRRSLEMVRDASGREQKERTGLESLVQHEDRLEAEIFVATLPVGKDPDDVIREDPAIWEALIEKATPLADYLFVAITGNLDFSSFSATAAALNQAIPIVREISQPAVHSQYVDRLAAALRIPKEEVDRQVRNWRPRPRLAPSNRGGDSSEHQPDDYLLALGMTNLKYFRMITNLVHADDYSSSENRLLAESFTKLAMVNGGSGDESLRERLDESLRERFDAIDRFRLTLPSSEGEELFGDMQRVALRLRRNGLRAENRQLQIIQADGETMRDNVPLAERQRQVLAEIREIAKALR